MTGDFARCIEFVLRWEGGLVDDPADPGGITNYGISLRSFPELGADGIRNLTKADAETLYRKRYWEPIQGDALPLPLALVVFDGAVNSGVATAVRWLQNAVGVQADGIIGPETLAACNLNGGAQEHAVESMRRQRQLFLTALPAFGRFGAGWMNRVNALQTAALKLAETVP